eukprot:6189011-Pleurochrysis_carterae.AAC.1
MPDVQQCPGATVSTQSPRATAGNQQYGRGRRALGAARGGPTLELLGNDPARALSIACRPDHMQGTDRYSYRDTVCYHVCEEPSN